MTPFWPVFATKSDGQSIVIHKNKPLRNGPTEQQLDKRPNDQGQCDFYRLIAKDDPKHIDWRKKLGGMLLRELGGTQHQDKWQQCILWELPENYALYEHIKTKADGQPKSVKNHSGGGHDRQDAYLYGYPKGPKKRFRSPLEFFPHLLWLCTDDESSHDNCACKMCSPTGDVEKPLVRPDAAATFAVTIMPSTTAVTAHNTSAADAQSTQRPIMDPPSHSPRMASDIVPRATTTPAHLRAPQSLRATPLPQPRSLEQQTDLAYNRFLCRTGEVVWFFRPKTSAWGLGLIARRWAIKETSTNNCYLIQPLSHPFESPVQELVNTDDHVKPWLAWSAPSCTFPYLQQHPDLTYSQIDWRALETGRYGEGIASVDASIMAAKAIDTTYTLFGHLTTITEASQQVHHYNGIYLGAEKIWRGEAVRLRIGTGSDLMVVTDIIERVYPPTQPNTPPSTTLSIIGDIYSYATLDAPDASNPPKVPQQNLQLPTRMAYDMAWRNRMLVPLTRSMAWWKLMYTCTRLGIADIKGRWYETSLLFQEPFTKAVKSGEGGNGIWMNSRGDATGLGKNPGVMRQDRVAAFERSVPVGMQLIEGLEAPSQAPHPPPPAQQQQHHHHHHHHQEQPLQQLQLDPDQHQQIHDLHETQVVHDDPPHIQNESITTTAEEKILTLDDLINIDHLVEDSRL